MMVGRNEAERPIKTIKGGPLTTQLENFINRLIWFEGSSNSLFPFFFFSFFDVFIHNQLKCSTKDVSIWAEVAAHPVELVLRFLHVHLISGVPINWCLIKV